jgi:hypothetical protein
LIGFSFIMLFDNVLWPDPAKRHLLHLLAASAEKTHKRLAAVGRAYLDPAGASALPRPMLEGAMSAHLALLSRADREHLRRAAAARVAPATPAANRHRPILQSSLHCFCARCLSEA